jgi:hypothetical protein
MSTALPRLPMAGAAEPGAPERRGAVRGREAPELSPLPGVPQGSGRGSLEEDDSPSLRRFRIVTALALMCGVTLLAYSRVTNADLRDALPLFLAVVFLQFAPLWLPKKVDTFSPPVFGGVLSGINFFSALAYYIVRDGIAFDILPNMSPARRAELLHEVLLLLLGSLLSYYAGYFVAGRVVRPISFGSVAGRQWQPSKLKVAIFGLLLVFLPAYAVFQGRVSGAELGDLAAGKATWREDPTSTWMIRAITLGFLPVLLYLTSVLPRPTKRQIVWAALSAVGMALLVTRLGQRGFAAYFFIHALVIVHYLFRRVPLAVLFVFAFAGISTLNLLGRLRTTAAFGDDYDQPAMVVTQSASEQVLATLSEYEEDRQRLAGVAVVLDAFPKRKDYLMGESWVGVVVTFVPRWLWPTKREFIAWSDSGIIFQLTGAPIPSSLQSTLYANFSWAGMIIGMFLWGWYHRGLYRWLEQHRTDRGVVLMYATALIYFGPTMLQLSATVQNALPALVVLWWIAPRTPLGGQSQGPPLAHLAGTPERA